MAAPKSVPVSDVEGPDSDGEPSPFSSAHQQQICKRYNISPGALLRAFRDAFGDQVDEVVDGLVDDLRAEQVRKLRGQRTTASNKGKGKVKIHTIFVANDDGDADDAGNVSRIFPRTPIRKGTASAPARRVPAPVQRGGGMGLRASTLAQAQSRPSATSSRQVKVAEIRDSDLEAFSEEELADGDSEEDQDELSDLPVRKSRARFDYAVPPSSAYGTPTSLGNFAHPSNVRPAYQAPRPSTAAPAPAPAPTPVYTQTRFQEDLDSTLPPPLSARSPLFAHVPRPDSTTLGDRRGISKKPTTPTTTKINTRGGGLFGSRPRPTTRTPSFNGGGGAGLFSTSNVNNNTNSHLSGNYSIRNFSRPLNTTPASPSSAADNNLNDEFFGLDPATIDAILAARRARSGNLGRARFNMPCLPGSSKAKKAAAARKESWSEIEQYKPLQRSGAIRKDSWDLPRPKGYAAQHGVARRDAVRRHDGIRPQYGVFADPEVPRRRGAVRRAAR